MTSKRVLRRAGLLAALVMIVAGSLWWKSGSVAGPAGAAGGAGAAELAPAAGQTMAETAPQRPLQVINGQSSAVNPGSTAATADPLPPEGAALAATYDELVERARRGEAAAARRLYRDVSTCRSQRWTLSLRNDSTKPPARSGKDSDADYQKMLLQWWRPIALRNCARAQQCEGTEPAQLGDPDRWLLRAAELGDVKAQVGFARGELFSNAQSLDSYQLLDRWRQQALPWLESAVANGEPEALLALGGALTQARDRANVNLLMQITTDDPERGYALLYALSRSAGVGASPWVQQPLQAAAERLDVSQRLRARRVGTDLYRQHRRALDAATEASLDSLTRQARPNAPVADLAALAARVPSCAAQVDAQLQQALQSIPADNQTPP